LLALSLLFPLSLINNLIASFALKCYMGLFLPRLEWELCDWHRWSQFRLFTSRISSSCEENQYIVLPTECFRYWLVTAHTEGLGGFLKSHSMRLSVCSSCYSATRRLDLPQGYQVEKQTLSSVETSREAEEFVLSLTEVWTAVWIAGTV